MRQNSDEELASALRDIQIAKLGFIGASIATIGDGIAALAAGLALEALERDLEQSSTRTQPGSLEHAQRNLDYYINELMKIRSLI